MPLILVPLSTGNISISSFQLIKSIPTCIRSTGSRNTFFYWETIGTAYIQKRVLKMWVRSHLSYQIILVRLSWRTFQHCNV
ncbi:hypothetical protein XELAEV_18011735mg [Xenopus laevis]|uniref:Uncharacterized protein n=1 Tax=Xenopus laevis TaxID=8355 RepID=A0A974DLV7_XENLA|nr:hypothetical protein XELAEV_18011735mg [Xenopus laevis]